jgi:putative transposase
MKRKRFTESQINRVLKEPEAGVRTAGLARRHAISEAKIYNWEAKYGGMEVSKAKRQRSLEDENDKLNRKAAKPADCRRILCWTTPR